MMTLTRASTLSSLPLALWEIVISKRFHYAWFAVKSTFYRLKIQAIRATSHPQRIKGGGLVCRTVGPLPHPRAPLPICEPVVSLLRSSGAPRATSHSPATRMRIWYSTWLRTVDGNGSSLVLIWAMHRLPGKRRQGRCDDVFIFIPHETTYI